MGVHPIRLRVALVALLFAIGTTLTASPASADYKKVASNSFVFWDATGSSVYVSGVMDWYQDGWLIPVYRAQIRTGSYVILNKPGCLFVNITWKELTGSVSWPPSASSGSTSDGWYAKCGNTGAYIWLNGIARASHALWRANVCIGYAPTNTVPRKFDACLGV